jgi:pimeloyl-ACP methyl ester carboxylesterase
MAATVASLLTGSALLPQPTAASLAPVPSPAAWSQACSASGLGLGNDTVAWAPVLAGDRAPAGGPVQRRPDSTGAWYPILLVHGWTGRDTVANPNDRSGNFSHVIDQSADPAVAPDVPRSLLGQLQNLPGAAVFTFDYNPYAAAWVTDDHLGPALGKVIDCLYRQSGQKVVLVGHSMGGLVARWAATHPGVAGVDRSAEISTVVTFGTPETGSVAANLTQGTLNAVEVTGVIRLVLSACGTLASGQIHTGTMCDTLPPPVRAFESDAGLALRRGSPQLAALAPWPHGIAVDALAGNTTFETPKSGWFHWPWETSKVSGAGDMIVTPDSAVAGAGTNRTSSCDYQLNAIRGETDTVGLTFGLIAQSQVATEPLGAFTGACFHTNLMRNISLTNEALAAIADDLARKQGMKAPWTAPVLVITPTSLGAVRDGMSLSQAEQAAGLPFPGSGDGASYPYMTGPDTPHLYVRLGSGSHFPGCRGAQATKLSNPLVETIDGFRLGDPVTLLKRIYGSALTYIPEPAGGGMDPRAGYVLHAPGGTLVFTVTPHGTVVDEIAGSTANDLTPTGCPG